MFEGFDTTGVEQVEIEGYLVGPGGNAQLDGVILAIYRTGQDEPEVIEYLFEEGAGPALAGVRQMVETVNRVLSRLRSSGSESAGEP